MSNVTKWRVTYGATENAAPLSPENPAISRKQTAVQTMKSFWQNRQDFTRSLSEKTRQSCYTPTGYYIQLSSALFMCIIQLYLIVYELFYLNPFSSHPKATPDWFVYMDLFIICYLFVECVIHFIEYEFTWQLYIRSKENQFDLVVLVASLIVAVLYIWELPAEISAHADEQTANIQTDNLTFLSLRIVRDVVRMFRVVFFINLLRKTVVRYDHTGSVAEITLNPESKKEPVEANVWLLEGEFDDSDIEENFIGA